jgi:hypothetical protein
MTRHRASVLAGSLLVALVVGGLSGEPTASGAADSIPSRLTDQDFWRISSSMSEPDGTFHSENLVSNEILFQAILPELARTALAGRAYVGVGSEQNFTYISALRPKVAFIVDIRRGNLDLHLVYKALFELSADRADFVSRLFSRLRPAGLTRTSTAAEIFTAFEQARPSEALYAENLRAIERHLTSTRRFALLPGDHDGIAHVYRSWFDGGPDLRYELTTGGRGGRGRGPGGTPSYAALMTATDGSGVNRSYLATDESFQFLKGLQASNLVVPVVGNLGGPTALRAVAAWLTAHDAVVSAFYVSNVEQYLRQDGLWDRFCASAATLPVDGTSTFIRSVRGGFMGAGRVGPSFSLSLAPIGSSVAACAVTR